MVQRLDIYPLCMSAARPATVSLPNAANIHSKTRDIGWIMDVLGADVTSCCWLVGDDKEEVVGAKEVLYYAHAIPRAVN